jgi:hypothetical protein
MHRVRRMAYECFCDILRHSPTVQASNRSVSQRVQDFARINDTHLLQVSRKDFSNGITVSISTMRQLWE